MGARDLEGSNALKKPLEAKRNCAGAAKESWPVEFDKYFITAAEARGLKISEASKEPWAALSGEGPLEARRSCAGAAREPWAALRAEEAADL